MRDIKFRGVNIKTGKMVFGGGIDSQRDTPIIINNGERYYVDAKTIGQFTGLTDKNGVDIYENDIVSMHSEYTSSEWSNDEDSDINRVGEVRILPSKGVVIIRPMNTCNFSGDKEKNRWNIQLAAYRTEVIGNIHENKDLLNDRLN